MAAIRPKIAVVGSINMDIVVRCRSLPRPGQTILAESSAEFCGGKGANQAVAAAKAGADVTMIGCVGNDSFADRLVQNLLAHGIDCDHVARCDDCGSGLAVISVDESGENSIMVAPGANARVDGSAMEAAWRVIEASDILMVQLEIPMETVLDAISVAQNAGVRIILDPAPAPAGFPPDLLQVDLLCPNESEAAALTGQVVDTIEQAQTAAKTLLQAGAKNVAITLADRGTLLVSRDRSEMIGPFSVDAIDTTAAGDAFAGALAAAWPATDRLSEAVRFANAAGALAATGHGAQSSIPSRHDIESLWKSD
jgi:ribokinase